MKPNKATGPDGITIRIPKGASHTVDVHVTNMIIYIIYDDKYIYIYNIYIYIYIYYKYIFMRL